MTEVVGSAAIELQLDRSRFNRDLRDLETLQLKPIALGVNLDLQQLQRQFKSIALAPIAVGLSADTSGLARQLQAFNGSVTVKAILDTTEVDRQLKGFAGERTLKLTALVDDSQLTALNKHLDLKQRHFAQVNDFFRSSPLTPRVDLSQLDTLDRRLTEIRGSYDVAINLRINGDLRSQIGTLEVPVILKYANAQSLGALTQKVEIDTKGLEDSLGNSIEQAFKRVRGGGLLGGLGNVLTAPLRLAGGALSTALSGLTLGATQEVSRNLGKGLSTALEGALSKSVGSSELLGEKVGGAVGSAVVQEFQTQTQNLAQVLEKQIDKIQDTKLRTKLRDQLKSVVELPGQVGQAVTGTIGQEAVNREGLFQRGQQRQAQEAKTPVVREEAVAQFRESISTSKSVEARATQSKAILDQQIAIRQQEVAAVGQRYEQLATAIQQAELGGAKTEDIAPLASELSATAQSFQALSESLSTLVQAQDVATRAVQEAKQKRVAARQQLDQVSPEQQPRAFTELAQSTLGESFDAEKLPKLVVDEARLKASGAGSLYVPAENAIITTNKIYEAVQKAALTPQQADTLGEEIAHAEDFDFGSFKGIQAAKENRPIGRRVTPTDEEAARFTPELGRYAPEKREAELNAKVKGARGAADYLQRQDRLQVVSDSSDIAVQGEKFTAPARKAVFKDALVALKQEASKRFVESDESINEFIDSYKTSLSEIEAISQRAAQSAGSATREEVAALQQEMNAAIGSLSHVFDQVRGELQRVQAIAPEDALQEKQQQLAGLLKQFSKKELTPLAEQFGVQDAGSLKKKDLIQQITSTADVRQLEPQVFELTRQRAQQQLERREQRAAVAETVGGVAKGAVNLAGATANKVQDIASSAPVQGAVQAAGTAGKALLAVGKAGYTIASGMEALALDLIPAGRAIKGIAQQTVVPAALFAGATALIPGGAGVAAGLSHVVGGVASPLLHAAGAGATDAATGAIAGHLPNAFGLANGVSAAITGAIDTAVNAATSSIAQAGAAILGGKVIQTAGERALGGVGQAATGLAALPPASQTKALPPGAEAIAPTGEGREGIFQDLNTQYSVAGLRDIAKRVGITSNRAKSLKKEDLARELSSTDFGVPIDQVLAEVGDSAKLKAFQGGNQGTVPKLPAEALTSIKSGSEKLKQLYKQFQTAQGQQRLTLARTIATESDQQIAAIDQAFKEFEVEGKTAQQLAGLRTQLTQRSELPRTEAREAVRQPIQETQRQGSASRNFQTINATVVDVSAGQDLEAANLLASLREGSQAVNRELGAAIERFNQAQHTLAETISREVARFAEIEPEATLPATLQKAAGTPKGKDLLVNTAGFAASVAGNHFGGAVGGAASDLIGALTARHALSGGQHGQGDELFGDLAGFAIGNGAAALGNLVPGVAGIPFKGAAAAIATVPQLSKLRQRIQGRLGEDDEAKASGDDLASANLTSSATGIKRTLTSKSRQLLSQLEKQLGDTIDQIALALSSDKDYAGTAGRQEIRALNQLNQTVERLLNERGEIINETFDAEMTRANQELLQIGARIAAKTAARPDFSLLADRAINDGTQAQSQQVIGENQRDLRAQRRSAFEQERDGGAAVDANQVRIDDTAGSSALSSLVGQIRSAITSINEDLRSSFLKSAELLAVESKTLLNDIKTAEIAARGRGDTDQANKLGQAGRTTERAIAGSEKVLSKPNSAVSGKEIGELQRFNTELRTVFRLLDRPAPPDPGGLNSLVGLAGKAKTAIAGFVVGFVGLQLVQSIGFQVIGGVQQLLQGLSTDAVAASIKLDNLKTALDFSVGGSSQGAQSLGFVRKAVDDLGTPLEASIQSFTQLTAATRGSASAGKATEGVFLGVEQASTVLGLSAEQTGGSLLALSQIASKGKVQSQELVLQLGQNIPGALGIAARAMGTTEAQLSKMLETGQILSDDFLPRFGKQLQAEFGEAAKTAGDNAQSALFRFQNAYLGLQQTIGKELQPGSVQGFKLLTSILNGLAAIAPEIIAALTAIALTIAVQTSPALFKLIGDLILTKAATGTAIGGLRSLFQTLNESKTVLGAVGIFALIEYFKLLSQTINTEVVKSFDDLADAAERAAKNSKEVKLPGSSDPASKDAKPEEEAPAPIAGPLDALVRGNIDPLTGKITANKTTFRNFGDVERDRVGADIGESVGQTSDFLSKANLRLTTLKTKTGVGADLQQVDQQLFDAQSQRKILQEEAERDFTRKGKKAPAELQQKIQDANTNIQGLVDKRGDAAKPFTDDLNAANKLIDNYKGKLKELDDPAKEGHFGNKAQTEERRKQLQQALQDVTAFKNQSEEQLGSFRVDPILGLTDGFKNLANAIEGAERSLKLFVSQQKSGILKDQLKTSGTDEDADRKAALKNLNLEREGQQRDIDAVDEGLKTGGALLDRPENEVALKGFGVSKDSSIEAIDKELKATAQDDSGKAKRTILEQLKSFKELQQKRADLQVSADETDLKVAAQTQTNALAVIDRDSAKRDSQLKRDDDTRAVPIRKASADLVRDKANNKFFSEADAGVAEANLGIKSARNQVTSVDQKETNTQQTLDELNAKRDSLSAEEFNKRQRELTTQLADLRVEKANAAAAVEEALAKKVEATNRKIIEGFELANRRAEASIQLSETNQTTSSKRKFLAAGLTVDAQQQQELEQTGVDQKATQQRAKLVQQELAENRKLVADKTRSAKEGTEKELALNQQLAEANGKLVDLQIQQQKELQEIYNRQIDKQVNAANRATNVTIRGYEREKAAVDAINKSLEISTKLTQSKGDLLKAIAQYNETIAQGKFDSTSKAFDLKSKAESETDPTKKEGYERILTNSGFGSDDKEELLNKKQAAEKALSDQKLAGLTLEYNIKAQLLELELKRDKLQAQQAVRDAKIAENNDRKEFNKAQGELKKAIKDGDPEKIAEAKDNLEGAKQNFELAQQNTASAQEGLASQDQFAADSRAKLGVEKGTAFTQAQNERNSLNVNQQVERVDAGLDPDQAAGGTNTGGGVQTNYGVQSGNYAGVGGIGAGAFRVGGFNNDDRGLRQDNSDSFALAARKNISLAIPGNVMPAPDSESGTVQPSTSTSDRLGTMFDSLTSAITQRLDVLIQLEQQNLSKPGSLTFHANDPVETYAQYQNRQTGNALRTQPAY